MPGKAQWYTPICAIKNREEAWQKIEKGSWQPEKMDTKKKITYFNNPYTFKWKPYYDHFFAYTNVHPLWDQRKHKENSQYPPDVHENIYQQEAAKAVPVLTSLSYGRREPYDSQENAHRRVEATRDFKRKRGVMRVVESKIH